MHMCYFPQINCMYVHFFSLKLLGTRGVESTQSYKYPIFANEFTDFCKCGTIFADKQLG